MQAPATGHTSTTTAPLPHSRVGRGNTLAPQRSAAPEGFGTSLTQAQAAPRPAAPAPAELGGGSSAAPPPAAQPTPAPVAAPATAVPGATVPGTAAPSAAKAAGSAPGPSVAEPEQGKEASATDETGKVVQPPDQPIVAQPAPLPVPAAMAPTPAVPAEAGDGLPTALPPALHATALLGAVGPTLHAGAGSDRPLAMAGHWETAPTPDGALEAATAVSSTLLVPLPPAVPAAALHTAAPSPSTPHLPAAEPSAPSPAGQVGPVLASFVVSAAAQPNAAQHLTIQLDPGELGRVQVHIERRPDGPARVELVVERPDTLLMLLRDQPQLHRALDLAGVPAADRTLQFQLAPPAANPGTATPQFNADSGLGQQRPGQPRQHGANNGSPAFSDDSTIPPAGALRRAGVNIMA